MVVNMKLSESSKWNATKKKKKKLQDLEVPEFDIRKIKIKEEKLRKTEMREVVLERDTKLMSNKEIYGIICWSKKKKKQFLFVGIQFKRL